MSSSNTHTGQKTEKRTGQHEWEYALAPRNIYDTLTVSAESDDSNDDNSDTKGTTEYIQDHITNTHSCNIKYLEEKLGAHQAGHRLIPLQYFQPIQVGPPRK